MTMNTSEGTQSAQRILRFVNVAGRDCVDTGRVVIGRAALPRPASTDWDAEAIQAALLEPRTKTRANLLERALGALRPAHRRGRR